MTSANKSLKKSSKPSIVYFGSGPVAAESLRLIAHDFAIEAVVTKPTTEHEMRAVAGDTPVLCVSDKQSLDALFATEKFTSQAAVLIDFGIIVSNKIIDYFSKGIVNSHFSLLPELRGADPISFAILEGKQKTGVSLMLLVEAMDEGPLLTQAETIINHDETTPSLTKKLIQQSAELLGATLPGWLDGSITATDQDEATPATYTRKLTKDDGHIDWSKSAVQLDREIRAFLGWPKSRARIGQVDVIITQAHALPSRLDHLKSGQIEQPEAPLVIACGEGSLCIEKIKPIGKKEMDAQAFLAGYKDRLS